ncbi:MAG: ATP-binding protein [Anaerolineae bacterium]
MRKEPPLRRARGEERLEAILDSIGDGIVVTDVQRRIVSLHGLSGSLGHFCGDIFQPSSRVGRKVCEEGCILSRAMEEGPLFSSPVECMETREKVHTPTHGVAAPVRGKGDEVQGALLAFWNSRPPYAHSGGDDCLCLVSHDMRASLTNIMAAAQTGMRDPGTREPVRRELLGIIFEEAGRLTRFLEKMVRVSALEGGGLKPHRRQLVLRSLVSKALARQGRRRGAHRFEFWSHEDGLHILADEEWTIFILDNLLDNAIKYSPSRSTIKIEIQPLDGEFASVSVTDSGKGIPEEDIPHIFDKFYRVREGGGREPDGFGLGLYLAKKLVEVQGGKIWAESKRGQGSKFSFTLPLSPP